jgi:uncharacterized protein (DUF1697 family)
MKYIAFLRGINVGGKNKIKMIDLKNAFELTGFSTVKTLLNSGNVVFETKQQDAKKIIATIEETIEKNFGFKINVLIRSINEIKNLVHTNPFNTLILTPQISLYVTFLSEKPKKIALASYNIPGSDFRIVQITNHEICSMITFGKTIDAMNMLEKTFGNKITTRNWNTVKKIAAI